MKPENQKRYDDILRALVLRHGDLVCDYDNYCGAGGPDWEHSRRCLMSSVAVPQETTWLEFAGTFEGPETLHGVEVSDASCACGKLVDRTIRWNATMEEVLRAVLDESWKAD